MKNYLIRREDFFDAYALGQIPEDCYLNIGSIWGTICLTQEQKNKYTFPIELLT